MPEPTAPAERLSDDSSAAEEPQLPGAAESNGAEEAPPLANPPTVFDGLREQYAQATEERRITIPIVPGRFGGNLAARYKPGPWSDYRKRAEKVFRQGGGEQIELDFAAQVMARCIDSIMFRPDDGSPMIPMHEANKEWSGQEPVKFDERLASAIGLDLGNARDPVAICRLVFNNPAALNDHFVTLDSFLKEGIAADDEEDDGEGGDRPT